MGLLKSILSNLLELCFQMRVFHQLLIGLQVSIQQPTKNLLKSTDCRFRLLSRTISQFKLRNLNNFFSKLMFWEANPLIINILYPFCQQINFLQIWMSVGSQGSPFLNIMRKKSFQTQTVYIFWAEWCFQLWSSWKRFFSFVWLRNFISISCRSGCLREARNLHFHTLSWNHLNSNFNFGTTLLFWERSN